VAAAHPTAQALQDPGNHDTFITGTHNKEPLFWEDRMRDARNSLSRLTVAPTGARKDFPRLN
jgi:hypothetical protein